jgi:hypothetical protein
MNNMKVNIFSEAIKNNEGQTSMRRIVTISSLMLLYCVVVVDVFTDYVISSYVFDGLLWIVLVGLGSIASEKFVFKKNRL